MRSTCLLPAQLIVALGNDAECRKAVLPERCCQLVTVITAKRCHCRIAFPKPVCGPGPCFRLPTMQCPVPPGLFQIPVSRLLCASLLVPCGQASMHALVVQAAERLGATHQQCLRRIEEGLSIAGITVPPRSGTLLDAARQAAQGPGLTAAAGGLDSAPALAHAPAEERGAPGKRPWLPSMEMQLGGLKPESAGGGGGKQPVPAPGGQEEQEEIDWKLMSRQDLYRGAGGAGGNGTGGDVRLFVGVLTAGRNVERRQAIRETWGSDPRLHRWAPP